LFSQLLKATFFAAQRHSTQRRKGPGDEPYVNHLIEAAALLATVGGVQDAEVLMAAVLHDVLEDTPTTRQEVLEHFGPRVLQLVESLTDDKRLSREERRQSVLDHLPDASAATKVIKLADLCSNVMNLPSDWSPERSREFLRWAHSAAGLCAGANAALAQLFQERWALTSQAWGELLPTNVSAG
jgi:guanosine-3',5'-bis(diphosphate) 3'-pyrophosphohydrolase